MKKYKIIILILLIITPAIYLVFKNNNTNIKKQVNVLKGSWQYNEHGGKYVFNDDYTYYQYSNSSLTNNYCKGTYEYKSGAEYNNIEISEDDNFTYYTLNLSETECTINNLKNYTPNNKVMVFSTNKKNKNELIMMNKSSKKILKLKKVNSN